MTYSHALTAALGATIDSHVSAVIDEAVTEAVGQVAATHAVTVEGLEASLQAQEARSADLQAALDALQAQGEGEAPVEPPAVPGWELVVAEDFTAGMGRWAPWSSPAARNAEAATDQRYPTLAENTAVEQVEGATGGTALALRTARREYALPGGAKAQGWTTSRGGLDGSALKGPARVELRYRVTASVGSGYAIMWWPTTGGWVWEYDIAEDFGGKPDGSRPHVAVRYHFDLNRDGSAKEQPLTPDVATDATTWRTVVFCFDGNSVWQTIDGVPVALSSNPAHLPSAYAPHDGGYFTIGKKMVGGHDNPARTDDALFLDYVRVYKPAP